MAELILLSIFIVVVGIWLVSYKVFQLIAKTYIAKDKEAEGPFIYYVNRVWAVTGLLGGIQLVFAGIWFLKEVLPSRFQGVVPDILFYFIYLLGLSGVYWLIKNRYKKAIIYALMLTIYLALTVLFNVFVSSETVVKFFTTLLMLIIYLSFSKRFLAFLETENKQGQVPT